MVCDEKDNSLVQAGCIIKELDAQAGMAELCLMAVRTDTQNKGLGRRMVDALKRIYSKIVTFADTRALGFYRKMGFLSVPKGSQEHTRLLKQIESCTYAELMQFSRETTLETSHTDIKNQLGLIEAFKKVI